MTFETYHRFPELLQIIATHRVGGYARICEGRSLTQAARRLAKFFNHKVLKKHRMFKTMMKQVALEYHEGWFDLEPIP